MRGRALAQRIRAALAGTRRASLDDLLRLAYPDGLDDERRAAAEKLATVEDPFDPVVARRILGGFEQQIGGPRLLVRFGPDDVDFINIGGAKLAVDRSDASVSAQVSAGSYEPHVDSTLRNLLKPGSVFMDVGANVGYHTIRAASVVGPEGRVLAVEANVENARLIACTISMNRIDNVQILPLALSDRWGYAHFTPMVGSNGGFTSSSHEALLSGRGYIVPTVPLDALHLDRLDVMKIDVEGGEGLVLAGGRATIERLKPAIVAEFSIEMLERVSGVSAIAYLESFVALGYLIYVVDRSRQLPVLVDSVRRLLEDWGSVLRIEDLLFLPIADD